MSINLMSFYGEKKLDFIELRLGNDIIITSELSNSVTRLNFIYSHNIVFHGIEQCFCDYVIPIGSLFCEEAKSESV